MGDVAIRLARVLAPNATSVLTSQLMRELGHGPAPTTSYSSTRFRDEDVRLFRSGGDCKARLYSFSSFASAGCRGLSTFKFLSMPYASGVPTS